MVSDLMAESPRSARMACTALANQTIRSRSSQMKAAFIPGAVIAAALMAMTPYLYVKEYKYVRGMQLTVGTVSGFHSTALLGGRDGVRRSETQIEVQFGVGGRQYSVFARGIRFHNYEVGQKIEVFYAPSDPTKSRINSIGEV